MKPSFIFLARSIIIGLCYINLLLSCSKHNPIIEEEEPEPEIRLEQCDGYIPDPNQPLFGKIVFSTQQSGTYTIYSMNADGANLKQLTNGHYDAYMPRWSPDGEQIVFVGDSLGTTAGWPIYLMNSDGSNIRALKIYQGSIFPQFGAWPAWSPDGKKIAFSFCLDCEVFGKNEEIFVAEVASGEINRLTDHPAADYLPSWSPDGSKIVFVTDRDYLSSNNHGFEFYIMNADGKNKRRLTYTDGQTIGSNAAWSTDGSKLAFITIPRDKFILLDPENGKNLLKLDIRLLNELAVGPISWSQNGKMLLFASITEDNSGKGYLYIMDIYSDKIMRILPDSIIDSSIFFADWFEE